MDLSLNAATSGMQTAMTRQAVAANNIANVETPGYRQMNSHQAETPPAGVRFTGVTRTPNPDKTTSGTDLAQQMVDLKVNNADFTANTKAFKVQDRMIGEAIDLIA
jgi:flagellar hook protein FlgE